MNNILYITYALNGIFMIAIGFCLGIFLTRKYQLNWRLFWIGTVTFILSQVGHIPFNSGINWTFKSGLIPTPTQPWLLYINAIILGLSAGLWEECARYVMFRWWAKDARSWSKALLAGAGHGGIEALIFGVLVVVAFFQMVTYRNADLTAIVPADQLAAAQAQIQAYWSAPWYATLLGAVERIFALCLHLACSVMVMQVFIRKQSRWLWLAIGWHALIDGLAVIAMAKWGAYATEAIAGVIAIISVVIIFALRQPDESDHLEQLSLPLQPMEIHQVEETAEILDNSRYNS